MADTLGMRIRLARVRRGIRQTELARRIGISGTAMNQIELGGIDPRASRIKAIADVLDVSADYLLGRAKYEGPTEGASQFQAKPAAAKSARQAGRSANGTRPAKARHGTAAVVTPAAQPEPSRSPAMWPHCYTPMAPLGDGQGLVCPSCRYKHAGET